MKVKWRTLPIISPAATPDDLSFAVGEIVGLYSGIGADDGEYVGYKVEGASDSSTVGLKVGLKVGFKVGFIS